MERTKSIKGAAAAALTVFVYGNHMAGQALHPGGIHGTNPCDTGTEIPRCTAFTCQEFEPGTNREQATSSSKTSSSKAVIIYKEGQSSPGGLGLRLGTGGWRNRRELNTTGKTIWLTGHLWSCQKIYDREVQAYMIALHSLATHHDYKKASADWVQRYLVEIFADKATVGLPMDCQPCNHLTCAMVRTCLNLNDGHPPFQAIARFDSMALHRVVSVQRELQL